MHGAQPSPGVVGAVAGVDGVGTGGVDRDPHLARPGLGIGNLADPQDVGPAEALDNDRLHYGFASRLAKAGPSNQSFPSVTGQATRLGAPHVAVLAAEVLLGR
jgi:hypothetical protein